MVFARVFRYQTRLSDAVAYFEGPRAFVVFLPEVGMQGAQVVKDRLDRYVDEFGFRPYGDERRVALRWGLAEHQGEPHFQALLDRALAECGAGAS